MADAANSGSALHGRATDTGVKLEGKARPILFSGPMVRALLAGTKTQTRRVVKPQPSDYTPSPNQWPTARTEAYFDAYNGGPFWCWWTPDNRQGPDWIKCPYGQPGDLLWVKERLARAPHLWTYFADGAEVGWPARQALASKRLDYAPSIHMPKVASRLTLEITDVRVERLQDISVEDADAECFGGGFPWQALPELFPEPYERWGELSIPECYARLWESINGPGSWGANPWVWAVEFKVHRANVDVLTTSRPA